MVTEPSLRTGKVSGISKAPVFSPLIYTQASVKFWFSVPSVLAVLKEMDSTLINEGVSSEGLIQLQEVIMTAVRKKMANSLML